MEMSGLKLMANTTTLILNPAMEDCDNQRDFSPHHQITVSAEEKENQVGDDALVSDMITRCDRNWIWNETHHELNKEDNSSSQSDHSSFCGDQSLTSRTDYSEIASPITTKVEDDIAVNPVQKVVYVAINLENEDGSGSDGRDPKPLDSVIVTSEEKICRRSCQNGLELSSGSLWGFSSICGRRQEMEDAIAVDPQLLQVPSQMLMEDHVKGNSKYSEAHFFGVYDGHGGCQVCLNITVFFK